MVVFKNKKKNCTYLCYQYRYNGLPRRSLTQICVEITHGLITVVKFTEGLWLWSALRLSASTKGLTTDWLCHSDTSPIYVFPPLPPLRTHFLSTLQLDPLFPSIRISLYLQSLSLSLSLSPCIHSWPPPPHKEEVIKVFVSYTVQCDYYQSSVNLSFCPLMKHRALWNTPTAPTKEAASQKLRNVLTFILMKRTERRYC